MSTAHLPFRCGRLLCHSWRRVGALLSQPGASEFFVNYAGGPGSSIQSSWTWQKATFFWGPIGSNCATPKVAPPVPPATAAAPVEETSVKEDCKTEAASATAGEEKLKKKKSKKKEEKKEKKKKKKEQAEELARARRKRIEPVAQSKGEGRGQTPVRL